MRSTGPDGSTRSTSDRRLRAAPLGGGADVRLFGRAMRLDLSLRNVLNQRYRSFLSRYKSFAFDPGRNLIVRLSSGFVD